MATISREQTAKYLYDAGFRGDDLARMVAIAGRESGYKPDAHRTDQPKSKLSGDMGLFQINYVNWPVIQKALGLTSKSQLFDPAINAQAAKVLFDRSGLSPWTAGKGGWKAGGDPMYGTDYAAAKAATQNFLNNPSAYGSQGEAPAPAAAPAAPTPTAAPVPDPQRTYSIPEYTPPTRDPAAQGTLTSLVSGFGIDYPEGPRATPQLLAWMRGLGMTQSTMEDAYGDTVSSLQRAATDSRGDLFRTDSRKRENIVTDAVSRGALVSGATNKTYARQAEDYGSSVADVERHLAEGTEQAETTLKMGKDTVRRQALERLLQEEESQATQDASSKQRVEDLKRAMAEDDFQYERVKAERARAEAAATERYNSVGA